MDRIVQGPCFCQMPDFERFCMGEHVCTCDADALVNAPHDLKVLWKLGAKHRPLYPRDDADDGNQAALSAAANAGLFVFGATGVGQQTAAAQSAAAAAAANNRSSGLLGNANQARQSIHIIDRGILRQLQSGTAGDGTIFTPGIRDEAAAEICRGIAVYVTKLAKRYDCWVPARNWGQALADLVIDKLERIQFGSDIGPETKPHNEGVVFIAWSQEFDAYLKVIHRKFVINIADKIGNNLTLECMKNYIIKNRYDLNNGGYYNRLSGNFVMEDAKQAMRVILCDPSLCRAMLSWRQATYLDTACSNYQQRQTAHAAGVVLPDLFETSIRPRDRHFKEAVPLAGSMPKIHKEGNRFLALCADSSLSIPCIWLTALFRSLESIYVELWYGMVYHTHKYDCDVLMWLAKNNGKALDMLRHFNLSGMSPAAFEEGGGFRTADVERMFTNMDLHDTIDKHEQLFDMVWHVVQSHKAWSATDGVVQVFKNKHTPAQWFQSMAVATAQYPAYDTAVGEDSGMHKLPGRDDEDRSADRWGDDKNLGQFYLFDLAHAKAVLSAVLSTSFVRFGSDVWKQIQGIPMGINPAVYVANYYLYFYELKFVKQLVDYVIINQPVGQHAGPHAHGDSMITDIAAQLLDPHVTQAFLDAYRAYWGNAALRLLKSFRLTNRFVDDLFTAPNPYFERLMHVNQTILGGLFKGIYPVGLHIPVTPRLDEGRKLQYMDIEMVFEDRLLSSGTVVVQGMSRLYDKREGEAFEGIEIAQYANVTSQLSRSCGYNIFTGQVLRYGFIISDRKDFIKRCTLLLHKLVSRGYQFALLKHRLKAFLVRHKIDVDNHAPNKLFKEVMYAYQITYGAQDMF